MKKDRIGNSKSEEARKERDSRLLQGGFQLLMGNERKLERDKRAREKGVEGKMHNRLWEPETGVQSVELSTWRT